MRARVTGLVLSLLLVVTAIAVSPAAAERLDRELAAAPAEAERLYLPSALAVTRPISTALRSEREARIDRTRIEAVFQARGERHRSIDPAAPASHDKRPLPRRAADDPPQPD